MKILHLEDPDKSGINYKISRMPDGQQNVTLTSRFPAPDQDVKIISRLNNWLDLELIVASVASLRELGVEKIHLYTPYFLGARSDRKFEEGGNNYLKDVICPIINSLNFKTVTCLDPHSHILEACIKNFRKESQVRLVQFALDKINNYPSSVIQENKFILISPDAGASHKIFKLAEQIGYTGDIITCSKERDAEGKLTQINVPIDFSKFISEQADFIIIDDICDGGRTFINIAENLKKRVKGKIYLIVTYGIFSAGFEELEKYFDGIYCTNSYANVYSKSVNQLNIF